MNTTVVDPDTDQLISEIAGGAGLTLSAAARRLPAHRGRAPAPSTIWRWHAEGVRSPSGCRVRLALARVGSRWLTSEAALMRFIAALTPPLPAGDNPTPTARTPTQWQRAAKRAGEELSKRGI